MLIAIEWVDGTWKATQTKLIVENLTKAGHSATSITYPAYGQKSCYFVEKFLNGGYGQMSDVNEYVASTFYILDRFDQKGMIAEKMQDNDYLISDRYGISNFIHRWTMYLENNDTEGLKKFFDWIYDLEYTKAGLPVPDLIIFLSLSMESIKGLIEKKKLQDRWYTTTTKTLDIAESDVHHQECSLRVGNEYLPQYFQNYVIINCESETGELLPPDRINEKILAVIKEKTK